MIPLPCFPCFPEAGKRFQGCFPLPPLRGWEAWEAVKPVPTCWELDRIKVSTGQDQGVQPTSQRSTGANVATTQGTLAGSTLALGVSVRAGDRDRGNERNGVEDRDPWSEHEAVQDRNRGN